MTGHIQIGGTWTDIDSIYARVGGSWKDVDSGYLKVGGAWEQFYSAVPALTVDYLVVAGGGSGLTDAGIAGVASGGGGAGGYRTSAGTSGKNTSAEAPLSLATGTSYTVTVGAGGSSSGNGSNGTSSVFSTIVSDGGGHGGGYTTSYQAAESGGSGGGGAYNLNAGGSGTNNQGFDGGTHQGGEGGAGGGGAGAVGADASGGNGGNGGDGIASSITGTSIARAGGGGGGKDQASGSSAGTGGVGGGGNGGTYSPAVAATSGSTNTGGGGGGGTANYPGFSSGGGNGGSGIVILKYPDVFAMSAGAGLTHSTDVSSVPGYKITTFTQGDDTISFSIPVTFTADYLVVAGGGGGSGGLANSSSGGGGGAGGYRTSSGTSGGGSPAESALTLQTSASYTVTVGAGGPGAASGSTGTSSNLGANSTFNTITSDGGGFGVKLGSGGAGGSGGGAGFNGTGGSGTNNQGFSGGNGDGNNGAGGGGGSGAVGGSGLSGTRGGNGGSGVASSITGESVYRAGGGGGAGFIPGGYTTGGSGAAGGGDGGNSSSYGGTSASANTGSGGGGGAIDTTTSSAGGNGGSGIVIVKYPNTIQMNAGAGLTYRTSAVGSYKVTEFLAGDDDVTFSSVEVAVSSDEDILQEIILGASTSSVTFENLSQYASTYQHLQIRAVLRNDYAAGNNEINIKVNGDGGTNYSRHYLRGYNSSVASFAAASTSAMRLGYAAGASNGANQFSSAVIDILDPFENTKNTTFRSFTGQAVSNQSIINLASGTWYNTNAVTSLEIYGNDSPSNWVAGSRFTLIGLK